MIKLEIIELIESQEKIKTLGYLAANEHLVPNVGDKMYFKQSKLLTVVEKQFRISQMLDLADITLVVEDQSNVPISTKTEDKNSE